MESLIKRLRESPVQYRHVLGILHAEYIEWRPEGKPGYRLQFVGSVPMLVVESSGLCTLLGDPTDLEARQAAAVCTESGLHELSLLGETAFRAVKPHAPEGAWRLSRNYGLVKSDFRPRPSACVRRLDLRDRKALETACREAPGMGESQSTLRDFAYMEQGLPVSCWGAFVDDRLVGFCSSNPMCRGVTEISWIVVAEQFRRRGLASGLLTAACEEALARGDALGYYAGSAGDDLDAMVRSLGFEELEANYRFIPTSSDEQWRTWGRPA